MTTSPIIDASVAHLAKRLSEIDRSGIYSWKDWADQMIPEVTIRSMLRAHMMQHHRPFIKMGWGYHYWVLDGIVNERFNAYVEMPRKAYLNQLFALGSMLADDDRNCTSINPTQWIFRFNGPERFIPFAQRLYTDPDIRRAMRVPADRELLPCPVTHEIVEAEIARTKSRYEQSGR